MRLSGDSIGISGPIEMEQSAKNKMETTLNPEVLRGSGDEVSRHKWGFTSPTGG